MLIPLKAKNRLPGRLLKRSGVDPPEGTWVYSGAKGGVYKSRTNPAKKAQLTVAPRMRAYWGSVWR
jgi:hypothetical protein